MMTLQLVDLKASQALDRKAMAELRGGAEWHLRNRIVQDGPWSAYQLMFKNYVGVTFHDGYLARQTYEGWKRTRTQTEFSYWDHFVRV